MTAHAAMISDAQAVQLRQSLTLGTARAALPPLEGTIAAGGTLSALAIAAMTVRFAARPVPDAANRPAVRRLPEPIGPLMSENLRASFLRLMRVRDAESRATLFAAAMSRLAARGLSLHPFDLPALSGVLHFARSGLGPVERAYLMLSGDQSASISPGLYYTEITSGNWREFGKTERIAFLRTLRSRDPDAARALLETDFNTDPAATRAELVETLHVGLGEADRPFLETLAQDRAASVRKTADLLLRGVRGSEPYNAQLSELTDYISQKMNGTPKKGRDFRWGSPVSATEDSTAAIIRDARGPFFSDVAVHLDLAPETLASVELGSDVISAILIRAAAVEGLREYILSLGMHSPEHDGPLFLSAIADVIDDWPHQERLAVARQLLSLKPLRLSPQHKDIAYAAENLRGPLATDSAEALLGSAEFTEFIEDCASIEDHRRHGYCANLIRLATLIPPELATPFRVSLDKVVSPDAIGAQLFTDFQAALAAELNACS